MKILIFHPTLLPPKDYGGVERVVLWLAQGLRDRGHTVTVAALSGSRLPDGVRLMEIDPRFRSAEVLLKSKQDFDVIHFMAPPEKGVIEKVQAPCLTTIHGNGQPGEIFPRNSVFLSQDHAKRHGSSVYVYNGVDPSEYRFSQKKDDSYLFLSKTSWKVKNLKGAIHYSTQAGQKLRIAGGERPLGLRFQAWLKGMEWVGSVAGDVKADLLSRSRALVFPVIWDEPFGLVMVEAWMSGTPVFASGLGSTKELVTSQVGRILKTDTEWIETLSNPPEIDPEACRSYAVQNFSHQVMAENYEKQYKRIQAQEHK